MAAKKKTGKSSKGKKSAPKKVVKKLSKKSIRRPASKTVSKSIAKSEPAKRVESMPKLQVQVALRRATAKLPFRKK